MREGLRALTKAEIKKEVKRITGRLDRLHLDYIVTEDVILVAVPKYREESWVGQG